MIRFLFFLLLMICAVVCSHAQVQTLVDVSKIYIRKDIILTDGLIYKYNVVPNNDTARYFIPGNDTYEATVTFKKKGGVVVPPDEIVTSKIDSEQGTVYSSNWTTHGSTTAPGWFGPTISYSTVANSTASFTFKGRQVELWAEVLTTHGTGTVTILKGTTVVVPETPVTFKGTKLLPALIWKSNVLPDDTYTIRLKANGDGPAMLDYWVIYYIKGTVQPVPPTNPQGSIIINPEDPAKQIIEGARDKTILFKQGDYSLAYTTVPSSVNLEGEGTVNIKGTQSSPLNNEGAIFTFNGGNQYIKNLNINGNNISNGGIFIQGNQVTVENVKIENCKFFGVWVKNNTGFKWTNNTLRNNSWSSTAWCSGELMFGGVVSDFDIGGGLIQTTTNTKGYAMKILWNDPNVNKLINGKIHGMRIDLNHFSQWQNGLSRNISIEFHDVSVEGVIEIYDMIFENQVSLALHKENPGKIIVRNSIFKLEGDTYAIETVLNNLEMRECQVYESAMILANFQRNMVTKNILVDKVNFSSPNGGAMSYGGLFYIGDLGTQNMIVRNSNIDQLPGFAQVRYRNVQGGVTLESSNVFY